jgi:hypothetical protein
MDKQDSRRIRAAIRQVLLDVWDPIGIKDVKEAQDEYDSYLGGIYELLVIVTKSMELPATKDDMSETVTALRHIPLNSGKDQSDN